MDKSTKNLLKKGIMKEIVLQNKKNELNLLNFLKKKKLIPALGTPITTIENLESRESESVVNSERFGRLINEMRFCEFDNIEFEQPDFDGQTIKAIYLNRPGPDANFPEAPFFARKSNIYETIGELCSSVVLGQFFGVVYFGDHHYEPLPTYMRSGCSYLNKTINLETPFNQEVFVKSITEVVLPDNKDEVYYATLGNSNMQFCGIDSNIDTWLSCVLPGNINIRVTSQAARLIRAIRSAGNEDVDEYSSRISSIENVIKLPAGTREFTFVGHLENKVYSSKDFSYSQFPVLNDGDYGFALVDLRNKIFGTQYPIIRDPLGSWDKQPFGGAKICTTLEFYTVENNLTI